MNPNNTLNPNQLFTSKLQQSGILGRHQPLQPNNQNNINITTMEKKPSLIPAEKHPSTHNHDSLSHKHADTIKDHYKQQLQDMKERKHEAFESFTLFTGYEPSTKEGAIKGLALAMKNGTYNQAAEVITDLIEYKLMCHAISTFCKTYNVDDVDDDESHKASTDKE